MTAGNSCGSNGFLGVVWAIFRGDFPGRISRAKKGSSMRIIEKIIDGSLMPHGHCLLWRFDLLLLHVGGDLLTSAAYFVIPAALVILIRKRDDLAFDRVFLLFAGFIFLCGLTHLVSVINVWEGYYFIEGLAKFATGLISAITAVAIWRLMPVAISMPSRDALIKTNEELLSARREILETNAQLERRVKERTAALEKLAIVDPLTNTYRRNHLLTLLETELKRMARSQRPLTVTMIDLDNFKEINDRRGHLAGDKVLKDFGVLLGEMFRGSDIVGRFGGEEFVIVMPECDQADGLEAVERFFTALRAKRFDLGSGSALEVTCSAGLAQASDDSSADVLLDRADQAMYRAKGNGKDCIVTADSL